MRLFVVLKVDGVLDVVGMLVLDRLLIGLEGQADLAQQGALDTELDRDLSPQAWKSH